MPATTVKLEGPILKELRRILPTHTTLTALVRELLESEMRRRRMADAANAYVSFLNQNPQEAADLDAWATAPLDVDPEPPRKRSRRRKA